jgi:amino acid transporter
VAWLVTKYLVTAALVVLVSEVAKRNDRLGALLVALPLVTILSLLWLHFETGNREKLAAHAWYTWGALGASAALTVVCFWAFARAVKPFGIDLGL